MESRRAFLTKLYRLAVAIGAAPFLSFDDLVAADQATGPRPVLVWLNGASCSGCAVALLDSEDVSFYDLITRFVRVAFFPDISHATGQDVIEILNAISRGNEKFIFAFEGGIPVGMPHACTLDGKPISFWVTQLASRASLCVAAGICASFGGIPKMHGSVIGAATLGEFMTRQKITTPLVLLPNCAMKPEHFTYTLLHYARLGSHPPLDESLRPLRFFGETVHQRCINYYFFQEETFARHIGDRGCLFKLGCQGVITKNDCLINGHNGNTNSCIRAGHPCIGCAGEKFPRRVMLHRFDEFS